MNDRFGACSAALVIVLAAMALGCGGSGQSSGRPDLDAIPEIERRGEAVKADLYQFRAKVRKRGVNAVKQDLPDLLPTFENYEKLKLGEHAETYKQIFEKLKALEGSLASSPSKDAVVKAVDEIVAIAEKLPGKADPNPIVE
jgi:hypothetical protein